MQPAVRSHQLLAQGGVACHEISDDLADVATQDKIMRELEAEGVNGFPFVRIGDQVVEGYQPDRYAKLLGI